MLEKSLYSKERNTVNPESLAGEVYSLQQNIDFLKDLLAVAGNISVDILKGIFKRK